MTTSARSARTEREQQRALSRAFLSRFFDNELTGGTNDLKAILFWLIAFLSTPGIMMPVIMIVDWTGIALGQGADALRLLSRTDKTLYLAYGMIANGAIAAVTWNSLLLDRRDALVLGTLPLRSAIIVRAKTSALFLYTGLLAVAIHAVPSVFFGWFLAVQSTMTFALHGTVAHFVASTTASSFVVFAVAGIQGTALAVLGPRRFGRVSPLLQVCLVGLILLAFSLLPTINDSVFATFNGSESIRNRPWILNTPPLWFLGLYEAVLGTADVKIHTLATWAIGGLSAAIALTQISYPLAYRRLAESAVQARPTRSGRRTSLSEAVVCASRLAPHQRAAAQFFLSSAGRVERLRVVVAIALGVSVGWMLPTLYYWLGRSSRPSLPEVAPVAVSLATMIFVLVGLRIVASLPADLRASWMFSAIDPPKTRLRSGLWRALFATGVLPVALAFAPLYAWCWGGAFALAHATLMLATGTLMIEMLLHGFEEMPCGAAWRPERAGLGGRWPFYLGVFLLFTGGLAKLEIAVFPASVTGDAILVAALLLIAAAVRWSHGRHRLAPLEMVETVDAPHVLDLT